MCITYFPGSRQVFGLFLGYDPRSKDVEDMTTRLRRNRDFIEDPFALLVAFLEIEQKHRRAQVDGMVSAVLERIENDHRAVRDPRYEDCTLERGKQQDSSYHLYRRFGTLRAHLEVWKAQLHKLLLVCRPVSGALAPGGILLTAKGYIEEVQETLEERISLCDNVSFSLTLAFQKAGRIVIFSIQSVLWAEKSLGTYGRLQRHDE